MSTHVQERRLLTVAEAAEMLRVSQRTIRRLLDRDLPGVRLGDPGASVRIDAEELQRWLQEHAIQERS